MTDNRARRAGDHRALGARALDARSSFTEYLSAHAPEAMPLRDSRVATSSVQHLTAEATTIVALQYADGVVMAGDRRATAGTMIASRDIEKVFPADEYTAIGISGAAGIGMELARLYSVELEHYEKIEGVRLSLDGKANRLASMLRGNLPLAMQGLVAVPILAGWDARRETGRIFSFDATGGRYEEHEHHGIGSGSLFARGALKKLWKAGQPGDQAVHTAVEALFDAADDDSATGGPDPIRRLWPVVATVTAEGYARVSDDVIAGIVSDIAKARG